MKISFISTVIMCCIASSCNTNNNICYVNPSKIATEYHGAIFQYKIYQSKVKIWQQRIDSLDKEQQVINGNKNASAKISRNQLDHYREAIQLQAQKENRRMTQAVLAEINAYIKQYGKDKSYSLILGATEAGNIVYAAEGTDITDAILKGLNAQYDHQHPTSEVK